MMLIITSREANVLNMITETVHKPSWSTNMRCRDNIIPVCLLKPVNHNIYRMYRINATESRSCRLQLRLYGLYIVATIPTLLLHAGVGGKEGTTGHEGMNFATYDCAVLPQRAVLVCCNAISES